MDLSAGDWLGLGWTENPIYKQVFIRLENVSYNIPSSLFHP